MQPCVTDGVLKALACDLCAIADLPAAILSPSTNVREANLSFNSLGDDSLAALAAFAATLETLILDNNDIASIRSLPTLPRLTTLWLNNNAVTDVEEVVTVLGACCPQLQYLSLLRNPCCPSALLAGRDDAEYRRYRIYVKHRLPQLMGLEASKLTAEEAAEALATGKFQRTAVHRSGQANAAQAASPSSLHPPHGTGHGGSDDDLFERHSSSRLFTDIDGGSFDCSAHSSLTSSFTLLTEVKKERLPPKGAPPKMCEGNRFIKDDAL